MRYLLFQKVVKWCYCNRDGLFSVTPVKGIDDKQASYDDIEERKALEQAAKALFG